LVKKYSIIVLRGIIIAKEDWWIFFRRKKESSVNLFENTVVV
jgi:hypothetical protein